MPASRANAQNDPFRARARGLTDFQYPTYQGAECLTIAAPRSLVWEVLTSASTAPLWLFAELPSVTPVKARFRKGLPLAKDDALVISTNTPEGPRSVELTVLALQDQQFLSITATKDEDVIARDVVRLTYTLVLEDVPGGTDLYWAAHYDPDSPLAAAFAPISMVRQRRGRILAGLLTIRGLAEAAALHAEEMSALEAGARNVSALPTPAKPAQKRRK